MKGRAFPRHVNGADCSKTFLVTRTGQSDTICNHDPSVRPTNFFKRIRAFNAQSGSSGVDRPNTLSDFKSANAAGFKYYVYISATKVDMLYSQIPPAFLKGAESEIKVNLGVISTSLKGRGPDEAKELPARLAAVSSYIRNEDEIGTVLHPKQWIE